MIWRGNAGQAFGLWNFVSKLTLAIAAAVVLPLLDTVGLSAESAPGPAALTMLTLLYAVVPGALKLVALALLLTAPVGTWQDGAARQAPA